MLEYAMLEDLIAKIKKHQLCAIDCTSPGKMFMVTDDLTNFTPILNDSQLVVLAFLTFDEVHIVAWLKIPVLSKIDNILITLTLTKMKLRLMYGIRGMRYLGNHGYKLHWAIRTGL